MSKKHKFSVFAHDANPAIDRPLCRKSQSYCDMQVHDGLATWLADKSGIQSLAPDKQGKPRESKTGEHLPHIETKATITFSEDEHNAVGCADRGKRKLMGSEMRAVRKVQMWPLVGDNLAVRVGPRISQ